jgi:hypothetical protein
VSGFFYFMIAAGVHEATASFWKGLLWPVHLGTLIGEALKKQEASK